MTLGLMFFINDSGNARYKRCRKQNPGFGGREQQRPHFITYKRVKTLLVFSQFPQLQWDYCGWFIMLSGKYRHINYGALYTLKSSSPPLLSVLLPSPLSVASCSSFCVFIHSVVCTVASIEVVRLAVTAATLPHHHYLVRFQCLLPSPLSSLSLSPLPFSSPPSSSSPVQPPQTRVCGPAGCASLPYGKFSVNQTATQWGLKSPICVHWYGV